MVSLGAPAPARAEPSTADRAIAERLFDRGRGQMERGEIPAACESFAESQRLDPGTGTRLNLAACYEAIGKLASAWVELREAVAASRQENRPDRVRYGLERLASIEPRLAYVTILVPAVPRGEVAVVALDGRDLGPAAWGVAIPVDPGRHEAVARLGPDRRWSATIDVRDGQRRQVEVAVAPAGAVGEAAVPLGGGSILSRDAVVAPDSGHRRGHVPGLVLGGAGIAALGVGAYFAWRASDLWSQRNLACPGEACSLEGVRLGSRADSAATAATWTIAGGVGAIGVASLLLLWPRPRSGAPPSKNAGTKLGTTAGRGWMRLLAGLRIEGPAALKIGGAF